MPRIRVLHILTRLAVRGVPRHVLELAAGLDAGRFAVEVMAGRSEPGEGSLWDEAQDRGIKTIEVEALQRALAPRTDLRAWRQILGHLRRQRYDIVHTHISKAGVLGRLAARRAGVPAIVHTYHGRIDELQQGSFKSRLLLAAERKAAGAADRLIVVSGDTQRYLEEHRIGQRQQYQLIFNGIDLSYFSTEAVGGDSSPALGGWPVLGAVGSLKREKGFDLLVEALPQLLSRFPDLSLCLVGDGPERAALQAQAKRLGLGQRVRFVGIVGDVRPWLAGFDLFVLPARREGMGIVLLEAMAMGKPVVGCRVGGIPEVVQEEVGLLAPPEDPAALGRTIVKALEEKGRRWGGRSWVEQRFSLAGMVDRTARLYERLLASKG